MQLTYAVNPYIPVTNQRHLVYVLVELVPGPSELARPAALNLGLVVDASDSMTIPILTDAQFRDMQRRGLAKHKTVDGVGVWQFEVPRGFKVEAPSNIDFTKEALRVVARRLLPGDRFSLVAFAQNTQLLVPTSPGSETDRLLRAVERLDQLDLGDETYMARGMALEHEQMVQATGPTVTSRMIVLTDGYTREEESCRAWAAQAKKDGITVSTMGLGLDFNEELLITLSEESGGHAYFVQDPADIPTAFEEELTSAQSITWRDMVLALNMPSEVTLRRAHRSSPTIAHVPANPDGIPLGDMAASQPPAVLMEVVVPPRPVGTYRLLQVVLKGRPAAGGVVETIDRQDVVVNYTERPSEAQQTNSRLMDAVQRVSAFKLQTQAIEEAGRGNIAGATRRLRTAGERLIEMGQQDLGQTMLNEATRMEKSGQMSSEGTKKLRYGTRKLK